MNKKLAIGILFGIMTGCFTPDNNFEKGAPIHFDLIKFVDSRMTTLSESAKNVEVKMLVNGKKEIANISPDSLFWTNQFLGLLNCDINTPKLNGLFSKQEGLLDPNSNLKRVKYSTLDSLQTRTQSIEVYYLNDELDVRKLIIREWEANKLFKTGQEQRVWLSKYNGILKLDSFKIKGFQKTLLMDSIKFERTIIVKN